MIVWIHTSYACIGGDCEISYGSEVIDFNFDGYYDLEILRPGGGNRQWFYRYIYDPVENTYNLNEILSGYMCININEEEQILTGYSSWGAIGVRISTYKWIDGILTQIHTSVLDWMYSEFFLIYNKGTLLDDGTWLEESVLTNICHTERVEFSRTEGHTESNRYLCASPENYAYLTGLLQRAHSITPEGERILQILKNEAENLNAWEKKMFESFREYIE
jgi:hypothetical protein